jgi:membrane-bound ClpP family serine protease
VSDAPQQPERLPLPRWRFRLHCAGAVLLGSSLTMIVLGLTVLADRMENIQFIRYWTWCFLLAILAIGVAVFDMLLVRRAARQTRRRLFREQFMSQEFADELREKSRHPDD